MNGTYTDTDAINTSGGKIIAKSEEMATELNDMTSQFSEAENVWSGQAFEALKGTFDNFKSNFDQFSAMFNDVGVAVKENSQAFEETEQENTELAGKSILG